MVEVLQTDSVALPLPCRRWICYTYPGEKRPEFKMLEALPKSVFLLVVFVFVFVFVALRPKSTAMVIAGRSVHLTTLFPGQA